MNYSCSVDECPRPMSSRELCHPHYERWRKYGDPLVGGPIRQRQPNGTGLCARCRTTPKANAKGYCVTCKAELAQLYRAANPEKIVDCDLRRLYRIDLVFYQSLWNRQAGLCAICERPERMRFRGRLKRLCVDHDAVTGDIRGLLCSDCNTSIGKLGHSPVMLASAMQYLTAS